MSFFKWQNKLTQMMENTVIPETPMFEPEFPPQEPESGVVIMDEDSTPVVRVETALKCLPLYDPYHHWSNESHGSFLYWTIRDYAHAYRSRHVTPLMVAEHVISAVEESNKKKLPLLISFSPEELRRQAMASTRRFEEGNPLSVLDGVFVAIKDDIDCLPYPTRGATTWLHKVRPVNEDAVCVSRLRRCGVIFIGKANLHELGLGTTGNNPNYGRLLQTASNPPFIKKMRSNVKKMRSNGPLNGWWRLHVCKRCLQITTRNPHSIERYTGGSSSGPAAIVACGLCPAALGTDGGGSIRIPSSLCGVVGLKTTYARTDMTGSVCGSGTVAVVAPIAATVEDAILVYSAMTGASLEERVKMRPTPSSVPCLSSSDSLEVLGSLRLGKYTEWFNDVYSTDISSKCEDVLNLLAKTYGCQVTEIVLPELQEMRNAHTVSIGSESLCSLNPDCVDGKGAELTLDTRALLAVFRSFSAADYVAAQRLRKRIMYYHMEAFKKVDIIVTPTTGMTAPIIPPSSLKYGESNLQVSGYLMRFILAGNLLGLPAISVPVGHDKQGLPIGLQLIGRPWGEATILRAASAVEELCLKFRNRPLMFYDILKQFEQ